MFKTEKQQCQAIRIFLAGLRLDYLWTETGPTPQACKYLKRNPLSHGEDIMLRAAFDLWNGDGKLTLWEIQGSLDTRHCERLFSLILAVNVNAVDEWIAQQTAAVQS